MKILHTSDWHLGKFLYRQKRYEEFEKFLDWLVAVIEEEKIDALLVAGDIFDNTTPSNFAQKLYYRFLAKVASGNCTNIVIIAGNHDSASFLNAPSQLLEALDVFVIGSAEESLENEVIVLKDKAKNVEAIVCAVPYLRERDVRRSEIGETSSDKDKLLIKGIEKHYAAVCEIAENKRRELYSKTGKNIPIIATGHLFTAGGKTSEGDGVRELYIGSLGHIKSEIFPNCLDYVALGHLHVPQIVGKSEKIRYAGSPIPMNFGEAKQEKSVVIVNFNQEPRRKHRDNRRSTTIERDNRRSASKGRGIKPTCGIENNQNIKLLPIPRFQQLEKIKGCVDTITNRIKELKSENSDSWLEVEYTGKDIATDLKEMLDELIEDSNLQILRVINQRIIDKILSQNNENETLDDLNEHDVFNRCMDAHNVPNEQRDMLIELYSEVVLKVQK